MTARPAPLDYAGLTIPTHAGRFDVATLGFGGSSVRVDGGEWMPFSSLDAETATHLRAAMQREDDRLDWRSAAQRDRDERGLAAWEERQSALEARADRLGWR